MTDRVILVPGPKKEVEVVRQMFQMALRKPYMEIVRDLNARKIPFSRGEPWTWGRVTDVLTNPKYTGCNVWGRSSSKLRSKPRPSRPEDWVVVPGAFKPVVDQQTFAQVQAAHPKRNLPIADEVLLEELRGLLAVTGTLSQRIIRQARGIPHPMTYINHFGSLRKAFELVGYHLSSRQIAISEHSGRRMHLRKVLLTEIANLFGKKIRVESVRNRPVLRLEDNTLVGVTICRCYKTREREEIRWELNIPPRGRKLLTLLCLSNLSYDGFQCFYLLDGVEMGQEYQIRGENDPLLQRGQRLNSLSELPSAAQTFATSGTQPEKLSDEAHLFTTV